MQKRTSDIKVEPILNDTDSCSPFEVILESFTRRIHALRALIDRIAPQLSEERQRVYEKTSPWSLPLIIEGMSKRIEQFERRNTNSKAPDAVRKSLSHLESVARRIRQDNSNVAKAYRQFAEEQVRDADDQVDFFFNGALTVLVGLAEEAVQQLITEHYRRHPQAIPNSKEHSFTYSELAQLPDLNAARDFLIERAVVGKLREDLTSWVSFIKSVYSLSAAYMDEDLDALTEIYQRRNIAVHNRGIANQLYFSKVIASRRQHIEIGDMLKVPKNYLKLATDRFELCFALLIADAWSQADGKGAADSIANSLNSLAYNNLVAERWNVAAGLSKFVISEKQISESASLIAKLNYWQSEKWSGTFDRVRKDVEAFDPAAKTERYKLAHAALLDDAESFFPLLKRALSGDSLQVSEALHWPIFREMRKDARFAHIVKPFETKSTQNQDALEALSAINAIADVADRRDDAIAAKVAKVPRRVAEASEGKTATNKASRSRIRASGKKRVKKHT